MQFFQSSRPKGESHGTMVPVFSRYATAVSDLCGRACVPLRASSARLGAAGDLQPLSGGTCGSDAVRTISSRSRHCVRRARDYPSGYMEEVDSDAERPALQILRPGSWRVNYPFLQE